MSEDKDTKAMSAREYIDYETCKMLSVRKEEFMQATKDYVDVKVANILEGKKETYTSKDAVIKYTDMFYYNVPYVIYKLVFSIVPPAVCSNYTKRGHWQTQEYAHLFQDDPIWLDTIKFVKEQKEKYLDQRALYFSRPRQPQETWEGSIFKPSLFAALKNKLSFYASARLYDERQREPQRQQEQHWPLETVRPVQPSWHLESPRPPAFLGPRPPRPPPYRHHLPPFGTTVPYVGVVVNKPPVSVPLNYPSEKDAAEDSIAKDGEKTCCVCLVNKISCVALPCMHYVYCATCARESFKRKKEGSSVLCNMCRKQVDSMPRVFS